MIDMSPQTIARILGGDVHGNSIRCPGPGHSATDRSMSITLASSAPHGLLVHTFSLADNDRDCKDYVMGKLGIDPKANGHQRANKPKIVASYAYTDETGKLLFQVVRYEPKTFKQRRPDGNDGWVWSTKDVRRVPYRLPELLAAEHNAVVIVEGEKDADNVARLGFVATCNVGGAGKWSAELTEYFKGREVFIIPDSDQPGEVHAQQVLAALKPVAKSVRIVRLCVKHKDVSDWIAAGGTADELASLLNAAANEAPPIAPEETSDTQRQGPLQWLDMSNWDSEPRPERKWAIMDRVPLKQVGLFSGEGGTGKSIIELMKDVAHVAGKDWLGSMPELGPAFYIGAEDDADEIHIRLADIAKHYTITFKELIDGGLRVLPLLGKDATLCAMTRGGKVEVTDLYRQLYEAAGDIKPKNISIDTLSRAFAGSEIDRVQVYAFATHMQALAMVAEGSVTVLSHPSLQGINSGSGISGSTAWHGAFRFRQYLTGVKSENGEQPDDDLREMRFKKNQYGPRGETMVLRYQRGLFLPEGGMANLDKLARKAKAEEVFLELLRRFTGQDRNVSEKRTAPNFAPTEFAKEDEAKKWALKKPDLEQAMRDLFKADRITVDNYGRPSRRYTRIVLKG